MTEPILDACCGSKMFYFDKEWKRRRDNYIKRQCQT